MNLNLVDVQDLLGLLACGVALLVLVPFVFGPVLIKTVGTQDATAKPVAFSPKLKPPPPPVARHFETVADESAPAGFVPEAHFVLTGLVPNVSAMFRVLALRDGGPDDRDSTAAIALFAFAKTDGPAGTITETQRAVSFATDFEGGEVRTIETCNSADADTFPRPPHARRLVCTWLKDAGELYRVHREHVRAVKAEVPAGRPRPLPAPDDWRAALIEDLDAEQADYVETGYFHPPDERGKRHLTWKGACLATWKLLPPVKQLVAARRNAAARAKLRAWGLDELA